MDDLEEKTSKTEETESTQTEETKSTETEEKSTVRMYDQKELDTAVGKGVSSIQSQLSISKANEDASKAELDVIKSLQEETERRMTELESQQFTDDPEALKGFRLTKTLELREKKATLREKEQNKRDAELDGLRWAITMNNKANELQLLYQVPRGALEVCTSEEQMETIAKAFPEVGKKPNEKTPKFAGAGSGGVGVDTSKMSADDRLKEGFRQLNKK